MPWHRAYTNSCMAAHWSRARRSLRSTIPSDITVLKEPSYLDRNDCHYICYDSIQITGAWRWIGSCTFCLIGPLRFNSSAHADHQYNRTHAHSAIILRRKSFVINNNSNSSFWAESYTAKRENAETGQPDLHKSSWGYNYFYLLIVACLCHCYYSCSWIYDCKCIGLSLRMHWTMSERKRRAWSWLSRFPKGRWL
jgi:hypothetical protein